MARETIKSFVYRAYKEGSTAEDTWRAAQSLFPHKCVSWGYIRRLRKLFKDGETVAAAFAELLSESRKHPI